MLDLSPETEPKSRPFLFIGATPRVPTNEPSELIIKEEYDRAYQANVKHILGVEGAVPIVGQVDLSAIKIRRQPPFSFTLLDAYGDWSINNPFNPDKVYVTYDEAVLSNPQDCFVVGENIIIVSPQRRFILNGIDLTGREIVENEKLSEGGRVVVGEGLVFASFGDLNAEEKHLLETRLFPSKEVIYVPTPAKLGIRDKNRATIFHIDQFIGGSLQLRDGRLLVPIDNDYYEKAKGSLPNTISKVDRDMEIVYFPVDCRSYYLLNYLVSQSGKFYLGPELIKLLTEAGYWEQITSPVETLPAELPVFEDYQAGMKCKLNLITSFKPKFT